MNRRKFFKTAGFVLGGALISNFYGKVEIKNFRQLRKGVGIYTNKGGTIGWLVSDSAVIVVDSQFPDTAKDFYKNLREENASEINLLINTHHHRDHTSGNVYLKNYSKNIVATENCVRLQKIRNVGTPLDENKVLANVTFKWEWETTVGKEKIFIYHLLPAHTGGDAVIHLVNANIVHMGDLVFNRVYPFVNLKDEASLKGWIRFLNDAYNKFDNDTLFIYGHSYSPENVIGGKEDLKFMANYLDALLNYVKKKIKRGFSLKEIAKAEYIPGFEEMKPLWKNALQVNINVAYEELSQI